MSSMQSPGKRCCLVFNKCPKRLDIFLLFTWIRALISFICDPMILHWILTCRQTLQRKQSSKSLSFLLIDDGNCKSLRGRSIHDQIDQTDAPSAFADTGITRMENFIHFVEHFNWCFICSNILLS